MKTLLPSILLCLISIPFWSQSTGFDPGLTSSQAFIKNEGQFDGRNWNSNGTVEYAMAQNPFYIFFSKSGLTYRLDKIIKNPNRDKKDPESTKRTNISELVHVKWVGANPNVEIIASEANNNYYSYAVRDFITGETSNINHVKGYQKLLYKDLYDNIDVEYVFHPQGGVKYSIILHPGANLSDIKLAYSSSHTGVGNEFVQTSLGMDGKMHIKTSLGEILEHEPYTYVEGSNAVITSEYIYQNNELRFSLGNYNSNETIIIDPWIVSPTYQTSTAVWEVETDAAGNVYTIGGESPMELKKYNSTGTLQWTYTTPWDTASVWLGTLATDAGGTSYITSGTTPEIERVDNGGAMVWHNASGGGFGQDTEYWTISFNCDKTKLIVGGTKFSGLTDVYAAIFDMDISNGNVLSDVTFAYTDIFGGFGVTPEEVRSISSARNAKFIYLTHENVGAINQNLATCPTIEPTFQVDNTHHLGYKCENYLPETQNGGGLKALVANDSYFYTHSGDEIHQWDLNTGAQLSTVALPGGAATTVPFTGGIVVECSGLAVDNCGNVYAGSTDRVVKFDANLNILSSSTTSFSVYDVSVNANGEVVAVGAQSDNSATNRNGRIESLGMSACAQYSLVCCDASFCEEDDMCVTDAAITLTPATSGGTWSGTGVNSSTGVFDPAVAGPGTHTITYTLTCGSESHDIVVSSCAALTACIESNGDVTVTSGTGPYTWYEYSSGGSTPITNQTECQNCGYTWQGFPLNQCMDGFSPVTSCNSPAGYVTFASGTTVTPTTYPIYVIDNVGDSLIINSAGDLTSCSSTCTPPTLSESITDVTCTGGSDGAIDVTVTGTSTYTYSWSNSATTEDISGLMAGSYTITVTDQADPTCTATGTYNVADGTSPTVVANATATTICSGDPVTLTGSGASTYTWDNGVTDGVAFNPTSTTTYTVTGTDGSGCSSTDAITVTVNNCACTPPTISESITDVTCMGGSDGAIDVTVTGPSTYTYSWSNSATTEDISGLMAGSYTITVTDQADPTCTATGTYSVADGTSPTVVANASATTICSGDPVTLTGSGASTYTWDNGVTDGVAFNPTSTTTYTVTGTDGSGCSSTDAITVTVNNCSCTLPTLSESITDVTCMGGSDGAIDVTVTGPSTYTYSWSNSATTEDISGLMAGSYTITVTDQTDPTCTTTGTYSVADGASPTVVANASATTICSGDPVTLTGSGASTYTWDNGVTDGVAFNPTSTTTYTVTGTDGSGCSSTDAITVTVNNCACTPPTLSESITDVTCMGGSDGAIDVTVTGTSTYTYSWSNSATTEDISGLMAGSYTITVTDQADPTCTATGTYNVSDGTSPTVVANATATTICSGSSVTLTGSGASTYSWDNGVTDGVAFNPTSTTTYTVTGTDGSGCSSTDAITVTVDPCPLPVAGFTYSPSGTYCAGDCITFTSTATYTSPASFSWNFGNGQSNVLENPGSPICFNDPGVYEVTFIVTDTYGSDTAVQMITISDCTPPTASFVVNNDALCVGECLVVTSTSTNATSYQWTFDGGTPATSTSSGSETVCFFGEGTYNISLVVSNPYGSDSTGSSVTVNPLPSVETIADTTIISSVEVELEAYGDSDLDYIWSPSTWIDCPDCQTTTATPQDTIFYTVTVTNEFGCIDTAGVLINVEFIEAIGVPSAFSPNQDGVNDILYVQGSGINDMEFRIYNRYGQKVFESYSQSYGWDGTFNGKPENPGVFVYYVVYTDGAGDEQILKGDVTLVR